MIVDSAVYRSGERIAVDCSPADLRTIRQAAGQPGDFVWVGMVEPDAKELGEIADVFGLHRLAVEDVLNAHQRPKLERYGDSVFLILKTLWYVDAHDAVETGEINLFVGEDFVVSVRHGEGTGLKEARKELERRAGVLAHGPSAVVYAVCDRVVDDYESVIDDLMTDVDEVEASVFSQMRTNDSDRIYRLKRELAEVRRAVLPLREPIGRFTAGMVRGIDPEAAPYFRDVGDHLARVADNVDNLDGLLSTAFDAHMARLSLQQNDDMRKISAGAGLVLVPTLIAGIYGMNFDNMPELHWALGYPMAVGLMVLSALTLWRLFKRSGWL